MMLNILHKIKFLSEYEIIGVNRTDVFNVDGKIKLHHLGAVTHDVQKLEKSQPEVRMGRSQRRFLRATRHRMDMTPGGFSSDCSSCLQQTETCLIIPRRCRTSNAR